MYLIDTNVISEIRKAGDGRADPAVTVWHAEVEPDDAYLSVVTLMEIEFGAVDQPSSAKKRKTKDDG